MKKILVVFLLLLAGATVILAGCTGDNQSGPVTTPTTPPLTIPATTSVVAPPVPSAAPDYKTEPMPKDKAVAISVDRNAVNPTITVTFRGGQGINFVSLMEAVLTRSDGIVVRDIIRKPQVNDQIILEGTKEVSESRADRMQVFITLATGDKYVIFDEVLPYKSRG